MGVQRYDFFLYFQIFLQLFYNFFEQKPYAHDTICCISAIYRDYKKRSGTEPSHALKDNGPRSMQHPEYEGMSCSYGRCIDPQDHLLIDRHGFDLATSASVSGNGGALNGIRSE